MELVGNLNDWVCLRPHRFPSYSNHQYFCESKRYESKRKISFAPSCSPLCHLDDSHWARINWGAPAILVDCALPPALVQITEDVTVASILNQNRTVHDSFGVDDHFSFNFIK